MDALVSKSKLKEALAIAERAAAKSATLPVLSNVLLSAEKNIVQVSATDLEIGLTYAFLATTKQDGKVVIAPRLLSPLLQVIATDQIQLGREGHDLLVEAKEYHTSIRSLDPEEFPIIPSPKGEEDRVDVDCRVLCKGLSHVVGMTGQSQARPEISGVLFVFEKGGLKMAATDSFRLAEKRLVFEKEQPFEGSFILPQKAARELVAIFGELPGKMTISLSPVQAAFMYESEDKASGVRIQLVSRLIEGEYPRYQDIIPEDYKTKIAISRAEFTDHIKAASIFAGKTNEIHLVIDPKQKELVVTAQSPEAGAHKARLAADIQGEYMEIAFNWRFLVDGLAQMKSENAELKFSSEEGPAVILPMGEDDYLYLAMPIRA
ncbi:MAG: DNA polymerase III subunit beta [Candidatus Wildermuthbacteria bacterium RIFCSPHIGHO2_12_FULL_45_9]|uniref:Beta sliding clamp n=1 Tax=Candidatus Wildermuthbacteria bacterium RIFCSPHIGHO2_02_FULL_45_25 TaxID=1802450 RepID=A0A1G2R2P1_9BACT|nr:MAG: DNA polymerase III subunit beta [Candidatus Wildermuthbacteria bacterium RIFCSPHIGHO2_02_FULL_45_25]OHA70598.1 MAG: DNA polymerase III subunit beta [Candidatus Wildermuthbacteria bacterium RIFCSPHIGHO2_12_FULL_45_9]